MGEEKHGEKHGGKQDDEKKRHLQTTMGGAATNAVSCVYRGGSQCLIQKIYDDTKSNIRKKFLHQLLTSLRVILRLTQAKCITIGIERQCAFGLKSVPKATTIPQLIMSLVGKNWV